MTDATDLPTEAAPREARRGRDARRAARSARSALSIPYITRGIAPFDILSEEGLSIIEANAETLLQEVGIEFRDYPSALKRLKDAGCDIQGERVRFPKGLARKLISTVPETYTQIARNPERSVEIGGRNTVFAPVYGSPFVHDIDGGRRYGTIEDFRNFVKMAYVSPYMHHSGGTVCEPVDLPVNKRHLDMLMAHMTLSDKPFMGSVTHPDRAADTVAMADILFGGLDGRTAVTSLINANSPLVWDNTMLGAAEVYAAANQACIITPFILSGAMSPVTVAGTLTQVLAEVWAGTSFCQLVRPGAPVIFAANGKGVILLGAISQDVYDGPFALSYDTETKKVKVAAGYLNRNGEWKDVPAAEFSPATGTVCVCTTLDSEGSWSEPEVRIATPGPYAFPVGSCRASGESVTVCSFRVPVAVFTVADLCSATN